MAYFLCIEVKLNYEVSFIAQINYRKEILNKSYMEFYHPIDTPTEIGCKLTKEDEAKEVNPTYYKSFVGSLRYLTCTKLDILYKVGLINSYMENPKSSCLQAIKKIFRYIKGIIDSSLFYLTKENLKIASFIDND